ncbi:PASTA domain-containing protein [Micromonospora sp. LOL_024]|uniref:PASTA domain-containing protein n=1 Tax=Micromonospora sp. LOL_024 TaxID=3345412 RepID=UPI003A85C85B
MTDGTRGGQQPGRGDSAPSRSTTIIGGGASAVLLAVIGAAGGWVLAGDQEQPAAPPPRGATDSRTSVAETSSPPGRTTPARLSSSPSPTQASPSGLTVPELVGMDFEEAREELRDRQLGWQFVFGRGSSSSVRSTNPAPGTPVRRGVTVVVTVAGAAPPSEIPDLVGDSCNEAKDELVEDGFSPRYPTGRSGEVIAQQPAGGTIGRWNDIVQIWCGTGPSGDESARVQ